MKYRIHLWKRLFSFSMALIMCLSMASVSVRADEVDDLHLQTQTETETIEMETTETETTETETVETEKTETETTEIETAETETTETETIETEMTETETTETAETETTETETTETETTETETAETETTETTETETETAETETIETTETETAETETVETETTKQEMTESELTEKEKKTVVSVLERKQIKKSASNDISLMSEMASGTCGDNLTWTLNEKGTLTISGTGAMEDWDNFSDIPWYEICSEIVAVVIDDGVLNIGDFSFYSCEELISVTMPESLTEIGNHAFRDCTKMTRIALPDGIIKIGDSAFYGCVELTSVELPDNLAEIGDHAFRNCTRLTSITIPDHVTSMGQYVFAGCTGLEKIVIPNGVTEIGRSSFDGCTSLITAGKIGSNCNIEFGWTESIPANAFYGCTGLTSITMPDGIIRIEDYAFQNCTKMTNITLPNSITEIGNSAFYGCTGLTELEMPNSLVEIGNHAFRNCTGLINITIPDHVTNIGQYAFAGCTGLEKIEIPDGVTEIEISLFAGCTALKNVAIPGSVIDLSYNAFEGCTSLISAGPKGSGCSIEFGWTRSIPANAFRSLTGLTSATLPDGIVEIGNYAFQGCTGLTTITIPDSVTDMGQHTFTGCTALGNVQLSAGLRNLDISVFQNCMSLVNITIPDGVSSITSSAFQGCISLETITIPDSVTEFGTSAFAGCTALTDVYYDGSEEQWKEITIGTDNAPLGTATIHYDGSGGEVIPDPVAPILSGIAEGHKSIRLTWTYDGEEKLVRYFALYRSEDGTEYEYIRSFAASEREYTNKLSFEGDQKEYSYKLVIRDVYDREMTSNVIRVAAVSSDTEAPIPVISPAELAIVGVNEEISFDASASTDNDGIASYAWDFGDGTVNDGKTVAHIYTVEGTYMVSLTVTDVNGNAKTVTQEVQVVNLENENSSYTKLVLTICDAVSLNPVDGAQVTVANDTVSEERTVPDDGVLTCIVPNGSYNVTVSADGYIVRTVTIEADGGISEHTIGISTGSIMTGSLTSEDMTLEEIIAAGIDTTAEENQHCVRIKAVLTFTAGIEIYEIPYWLIKNANGEVVQTSGDNSDGRNPFTVISGGNGFQNLSIGVFPITENFVLVVYGEAHWLKEMYKVELIVNNRSNTDTLEQVTAELELPEGLSLAEMTYGSQKQEQELGSIGYSDSANAAWYVRGDKEGEYNLTVDVAAVTMPYGEFLRETYTTSAPIKVYAGSALHLTITADDVVSRGEDYTVKFRLENVSDKSIYNFSFGITGSEQYKVIGFGNNEAWLSIDNTEYGEDWSRMVKELAPGGYVEMELSTTIWFNSALELIEFTKVGAFVDAAYYLTDVSIVTLNGSTTTIPYNVVINRTDRTSIIDKLINELYEQLFGEIVPSGSLGGTMIEIAGMALDSKLIKGAKTVLSLMEGETDHKLVISIDDGLGTEDSIYNDVVTVTTGDSLNAIVDTLNGTKLTVNAGEVSIQAKGAGSTKVKIGVTNNIGELEKEYTLNVVVEDTEVKETLTLTKDSAERSFSINENSWSRMIEHKRQQEKETYTENPFMWFDSTLVLDTTEVTTGDSEYSVQVTGNQMDDLLNGTATTHMELKGGVANLDFAREALQAIAEVTGQNYTFSARRLSDEEAAQLGSENPTYEFTVYSGDNEICDFGEGEVYVTLPYELPNTSSADEIYVEHIRDDGSIELLEAEYDSEMGMVSFYTKDFSYFRLMQKPHTHMYGEPVFAWTDDHTCTVTASCEVCGEVQNFTSTVSSETVAATEVKNGELIYTATVVIDGKTYTNEYVVTIPAGTNTGSGTEAPGDSDQSDGSEKDDGVKGTNTSGNNNGGGSGSSGGDGGNSSSSRAESTVQRINGVQSGDQSHPMLWALLLLITATSIVGILWMSKKKHSNKM